MSKIFGKGSGYVKHINHSCLVFQSYRRRDEECDVSGLSNCDAPGEEICTYVSALISGSGVLGTYECYFVIFFNCRLSGGDTQTLPAIIQRI